MAVCFSYVSQLACTEATKPPENYKRKCCTAFRDPKSAQNNVAETTTCKDKRAHAGDEARQKAVERKGSNEETVEELHRSG